MEENTARSVVIDGAGSYEKLRLESSVLPDPKPDELVIEVKAIGVNYADCVVRMGLYSSAKKYVGWPITPGFEVSGVVAKVGSKVTKHKVGDEVFAVTRFGGYTSRLVAPEHQVFAKPSAMSFEEAAGFPSVYLTAYFALVELANPHAGDKLLVHSAAGGVGGCLTQIGKLLGCHVTGVVGSTHKRAVAVERGADVVIDKSRQNLWDAAKSAAPVGFDIIADANGVATLGDSYKNIRPGGKLVVYGFHTMLPKSGGRPNWLKLARDYLRTPRFNPLDLTTRGVSVLAFNLSYMFDRREVLGRAMPQLLRWYDEGKIAASSFTSYPLDRVADAHRDLESGQTTGKLILLP